MSLEKLLTEQDGVATRDQLRSCGMTSDQIRSEIRAQRWQALNELVICTHNGPLTRSQARWAAVLSASGPVALCGLTALAAFGIVGFETASVHVLVVRGARLMRICGVDVVAHESRRFSEADVLPRLPPVTGLERATIDAAIWSADVKTAARILVAPIQQRRTTAARLGQVLVGTQRVRYRPVLIALLADLDGGAEALSEVAFLRWCRRHGLPRPALQVRLDSQGRRRYLDAVFERADGSSLFVEIDGGIHLTLAARWLDSAKDNDAVIARQMALRFPSIAIYSDDPIALRQLRAGLGSVRTNGGQGAVTV
jgi:hypothetical protein